MPRPTLYGRAWPTAPPETQTPDQIRWWQLALRAQKRCPSCGVLQPVSNYRDYGAHVACWTCAGRRER